MMDTPKRENDEASFWDRLLDVVLLAKAFEWDVDDSPEACAEELSKLAKPRAGVLDRMSQDVRVGETHDPYTDFEVAVKRYGRGSYKSARAIGRIIRDKGRQKTVVRGKVRLGIQLLALPVFSVVMLFWTYVFITRATSNYDWAIAIIFAALAITPLFSFRTGMTDRTKLYDLLQDTLSMESESQKKKRDSQ